MIAPVVLVAVALDWWPQFLALAERLGAAVETVEGIISGEEIVGEVIVYTGRSLTGAWVFE